MGKISKIEIITYLGVLVAILVRLMPGATRIIFALQKAKFFEPKIDLVFKEYKLKKSKKNIKKRTLKIFDELEVKNLHFRYPGQNLLLKNINFKIKKRVKLHHREKWKWQINAYKYHSRLNKTSIRGNILQ